MKTFPAMLLYVSTIILSATPVPAMELGDPAPPLEVAEWIKGQPVSLEDGKGKTVYVVEFWATWCPPCRASIPHLSRLQKKHKEVVIVGISNEPPEKVKSFLKKMGDQMNYVVAVDKSPSKTTNTYLQPFGVKGIPHAFVVDKKGRIAWHGHPMANLDQVLEKIVRGEHDIEAAKKTAKAKP